MDVGLLGVLGRDLMCLSPCLGSAWPSLTASEGGILSMELGLRGAKNQASPLAHGVWGHFRNICQDFTCRSAAEKFDGCLRDLQPFEDREDEGSPLLNPRLSISARFLSRAQKNCRFAAAFFPRVRPLAQAASAEHFTEESLPLSDFAKFKKPPAEIQLELKGSPDAKTSCVSEIQGLVKSFELSLQALRLKFQETLQLYDKVSSCTDGTPEEFTHAKHRLSSTFCWMKSELAKRDSRDNADVATATDPSSFWPSCLQEGEAHVLLKHYSDSLLNLVQKKLEEAQKTSLP